MAGINFRRGGSRPVQRRDGSDALAMSAFGGKADIALISGNVCFRPKADMGAVVDILSLPKHYALAARLDKAQAVLTVHGRGY